MKTVKDELKAMITLFKAHQQLIKYIKEDIKETNLDLNEFSVLEVVYHYKNITVAEIHDKVLVAASSLSYILDKLESKEFIKRIKSPTDKRSFIITLTEKGQKYSKNIFPSHYEGLIRLFSVLDNNEKDTLSNLLKKVGLYIKEINNA